MNTDPNQSLPTGSHQADWRLTAENSVLVVIDLQEKLMATMPRRDDTLAAARRLIAVAGILEIPTVMTLQYVKGLGPVCEELREATAHLSPIEKTAFSCCGADGFQDRLAELDRSRVILCGVETHVCVLQTAMDLLAAGRSVYVCADAVCSRRDSDAAVALERLRDGGAVITTVESAVFEVLRDARSEHFKACLPLLK